MTDASHVVTATQGALGRIRLNRPQALHALTQPMCVAMLAALRQWASQDDLTCVLVDHAGERGFCAGGDIAMLARSGAADGQEARAFFATEYRLNTAIHRFPKPYIAIMDGITMGGGVGISVHGGLRIATERTRFAMPETGIGLFPDVGGGWFLPRLPGQIGIWLALTGARLNAADCLEAGIATHFVPSARLDEMKAALLEGSGHITDQAAAAAIIAPFCADPGPSPLRANRGSIAEAFVGETVEGIIENLRQAGTLFAQSCLESLAGKSPQTLKVALRQMRQGALAKTFEEVMAMEYRIACRVVQRHDFLEGVRAVIVDKDGAPKWHPAALEQVDAALLDGIFAPLPPEEEWRS